MVYNDDISDKNFYDYLYGKKAIFDNNIIKEVQGKKTTNDNINGIKRLKDRYYMLQGNPEKIMYVYGDVLLDYIINKLKEKYKINNNIFKTKKNIKF